MDFYFQDNTLIRFKTIGISIAIKRIKIINFAKKLFFLLLFFLAMGAPTFITESLPKDRKLVKKNRHMR